MGNTSKRRIALAGKLLLGAAVLETVFWALAWILSALFAPDKGPVASMHHVGHRWLAVPVLHGAMFMLLLFFWHLLRTNQRATEQALRDSEKLYRGLAESAQDYIYIIDRNSRIEYVNTFAANAFDLRPEDLIGKRRADLFPPDVAQLQEFHLRKVFDTGQPQAAESEIVFPGRSLWLDTRLIPIKNPDGTVRAVLGVSRDLTERKRMEEQLRQSQTKYQRLFDNAFVGLYRTAVADGTILECNQHVARILGCSDKQDLIGTCKVAHQYVDPGVREKMLAAVRAAGEIDSFEARVRRLDGQIIWVSFSAKIHPEQGYLEGVIVDVTERKRWEQALQDSESRYRSLVETSPDAILWVNLNGEVIIGNHQAALLHGYDTVADMLSHKSSLLDYVSPADRQQAEKAFRRVLKHGKAINDQFTLLRRDGSEFPAEINASVTLDAQQNPTGLVGIARDITDRKRAEQQIRRHHERLEDLVKQRTDQVRELERQRTESEKLVAAGRVAARVAHEISNPLAGIKNAFLLVKDAVPVDHPHHQYVSRIESEIDRISRIVRHMFDLYRPGQVALQTFAVDEMIRDVVALLEPSCREHNVSIRVAPCRTGIVTLPEDLLRQALYNVVVNAIEVSPSGGAVELDVSLDDHALHVAVADHGPGIPDDLRTRIFESFFTTKTRSSGGGLGLGLSVTRDIVEAMNGSLTLHTRPGEGSRFDIVVPLESRGQEIDHD